MKTLVAGIGHLTLRDLSFGLHVIRHLGTLPLPPNVHVEDFSTSAVAALHRLKEGQFDKVIFLEAVPKGGAPGTIYRYTPEIKLPDPSEIQERMAESISGAISLDDILIISKYYDALPKAVIVIQVEPLEYESHGLELSPPVQQAMDRVLELVVAEIADEVRSRKW